MEAIVHSGKVAMLKITLLDSAGEFRLRLEGKLAGPWVSELRQCWETASSTTAGRKTVVDLREVDYVDDAGGLLLADMHGREVELVAITPLIRTVVEECTQRCDRVEGKPARSIHAFFCPDPSGPNSRAS